MSKVRRGAISIVSAIVLTLSLLVLTATSAGAVAYGPLALQNGWTNSPFSTNVAAAASVSGIVTLRGAIATAGTNPVAFTLPPAMRPAADVYVAADMCGATNGRLYIQPSGVVTVQTATFSNAQCFTSLDGVTFARLSTGYTAMTLQNGWTNAPFSTRNAAAATVTGVVHFEGAIATAGTNPVAFTLPAGMRPATDVYAAVDMCNSTNGRLYIQPSGVVTVQAETAFSNAQCFTSLDGASFALSATGYTAMTLQNGWTNAPFATSNAAAASVAGVIHFKGAIATAGTNPVAFTVPAAWAPATDVYIAVDMCNATNGRLYIQHSGVVTVQAETAFSNAQCFTSLDGASYSLTKFAPLVLQNGWTNSPFTTNYAAASSISGIVTLRGAIATTGTNPVAFTLPPAMRPAGAVYVKADMCGATNGRLYIQTSGVVTVQAETSFSNAQCFTSLDGVTFARSTTGYTAITLQNGWTNAPFSTRNAAAATVSSVVHLEGAIASGTTGVAFTLPAGMRPPTDTYVPVDMCNATNGRLYIQPSGVVTVQAETAFSNAQCFTSLDGASFALSATGYTAMTLLNGWTNAPFSTRNAAAALVSGVVQFEGAIATAGTNPVAFTLPATMAPATDVYVAVDLCNATNGRLWIQHSGVVTVQAATFSNAQCFTSLEGVSFAQ